MIKIGGIYPHLVLSLDASTPYQAKLVRFNIYDIPFYGEIGDDGEFVKLTALWTPEEMENMYAPVQNKYREHIIVSTWEEQLEYVNLALSLHLKEEYEKWILN